MRRSGVRRETSFTWAWYGEMTPTSAGEMPPSCRAVTTYTTSNARTIELEGVTSELLPAILLSGQLGEGTSR